MARAADDDRDSAGQLLNLPQLFIKPGVDLNGLRPAGCRILAVLTAAPLALGFDITISCGLEGHGSTDPHSRGEAMDVRTLGLTATQVFRLYGYCTSQLGDLFTVLYEVPEAERSHVDPLLQPLIYKGKSSPT